MLSMLYTGYLRIGTVALFCVWCSNYGAGYIGKYIGKYFKVYFYAITK